ncbi:MAG: DUF3795 domain-containing protein [Candidatus Thorarchaeota archaeon]|nr:MAG: DUF3795 domain-containing protein [Candidatus Thorarchaeota archaeon]
MSAKLIAYCGLDCAECPARIALETDDNSIREQTVDKWNSPEFPVSVDDVNCTYCTSPDGPHFKWCADCPLRSCGSERGVETCAHCGDFPCDKVHSSGEANLKRLQKIHASLV